MDLESEDAIESEKLDTTILEFSKRITRPGLEIQGKADIRVG